MSLGSVLVIVAGSAAWVSRWSSGDAARAPIVAPRAHKLVPGPVVGSLVLPLTGGVEASGIDAGGAGASGGGTSALTAKRGGVPVTSDQFASPAVGGPLGGASADQSVDVPPGTSQTMQRLSTHVSSDGLIVSTFYSATDYQPAVVGPVTAVVSPVARVVSSPPAQVGFSEPANASQPANSHPPATPVNDPTKSPPGRSTSPADSCIPTGELTLEISDTQAVATFTEPFYGGFTDPLIDLEIGELGVTEGDPATWVEAQVGPAAKQVIVQFADGSTDSAAPAGGVAVLAKLGDASSTLGNGTQAYLEVLGVGGALLAKYALGVGAPGSSGPAPSAMPGTGASVAPDGGVAVKGVTSALTTALSCGEPPVLQSQAVAGGGPFEELGGAGSSGIAPGDRIVADKVVFTSSTSAVVRYHIASPGSSDRSSLYADALLSRGSWLLSLDSVAPGLQIAPVAQDGDVAVAPGGPLFVHTGAGGVAIAVYRAATSGSSTISGPARPVAPDPSCGTRTCTPNPSTACAPTGGIVEEITTPGAVGIESAPLFGSYSDPVVGIAIMIVGEAEGAPATVVGVESGPSVSSVAVATAVGTQSFAPVDGEVAVVVDGPPSSAIGSSGGKVTALDASGGALASVPLLVDSTEPAPASSLPTTLPAPGTTPPDPAGATSEIDQALTTVFDCANSPLVRSGEIQDNGMFADPLEQLYAGPYTDLVESVYTTVNDVVFVNPQLADVSYTIKFHGSSLTYDMIGSAVVVDGSWRVSYASLCAAVSLGGVSCSS